MVQHQKTQSQKTENIITKSLKFTDRDRLYKVQTVAPAGHSRATINNHQHNIQYINIHLVIRDEGQNAKSLICMLCMALHPFSHTHLAAQLSL